MSITIRNDLPPPPPEEKRSTRGPITIALEALQPGQCAEFDHPANLKYSPPAVCAAKIAKRTGRVFREKREGDVIRVWRIS